MGTELFEFIKILRPLDSRNKSIKRTVELILRNIQYYSHGGGKAAWETLKDALISFSLFGYI